MAAAVSQIPTTTPFGAGPAPLEVRNTALQDTHGPRDIHTELHYYKDPEDGSAPHPTYVDKPETFDHPTEVHPATIHDVRGNEATYTLDGDGFEFIRREAQAKEFLDDEKVKAGYYPEVEQLLKDVTGASKVFIFDHTVRRQSPGAQSKDLRGPVQRVHIDQSYTAALSRVPYHLPDEADELLKGRVQIINVWRPVKTVLRDPLAVAHAHSVPHSDLVPVPLIYPTRKGETYAVRYNDSHKWFYKSRLEPGEALLIKCFDSKTDGRARAVPHSAFVDPEAGDEVPTRESIEVRALVFHPEDRD